MTQNVRIDEVSKIEFPAYCPICNSPYLTFVKKLKQRSGGSVGLYFCMNCQSASSPLSRVVPESDVTAWHLSVHERNMAWANQLFDAIDAEGPLVDIGCGVGSLLQAGRERGMSTIGFDLNPWACQVGREKFGLDLRNKEWRKATAPPAKTITCISVLEHIHFPRVLMFEMVSAAVQFKAQLFISVPFFSRLQWPKILTDNLQPGHFFEIPHSHVSHFSPQAVEDICRAAGAKDVQFLKLDGAWEGYLVRGG